MKSRKGLEELVPLERPEKNTVGPLDDDDEVTNSNWSKANKITKGGKRLTEIIDDETLKDIHTSNSKGLGLSELKEKEEKEESKGDNEKKTSKLVQLDVAAMEETFDRSDISTYTAGNRTSQTVSSAFRDHMASGRLVDMGSVEGNMNNVNRDGTGGGDE